VALVICCNAVFVLPEIYTLWQQFDLHPEKVVFHKHGVSGIKWFLWDSQFGRFNSTGYIKRDDGSYFFFMHTLLWAFAPWAFLFYAAVFIALKKMITRVKLPEYVTISGAGLMLFIFSISQFQLPFYTNILFPFFAIITAAFIRRVIVTNQSKFFKVSQYTVTGILIVAFVVLNFIFSPEHFVIFSLITAVLLALSRYIFSQGKSIYYNLFLFTCCVSVWLNAYFITIVYPTILRYKPEVQASTYVNEHLADQPIVVICAIPNAFPFYIPRPVPVTSLSRLLANPTQRKAVVLIDDGLFKVLNERHIGFTVVKQFDDYPQENLTLPFIIESERYKTLDSFYLVRLNQ
jgi:hypothetical protein